MCTISRGLVALVVLSGKLARVCFASAHVTHGDMSVPVMYKPLTASLAATRLTCATFMCASLSCANCMLTAPLAAHAEPCLASFPQIEGWTTDTRSERFLSGEITCRV